MTTFADLADFYDPDLHLPIDGVTYTIQAPNFDDGLTLHRFYADPDATATGLEQLRWMAKLLGATETDDGGFTGGVWSQIVDAGHGWDILYRVGRTALLRYGMGEEAAEMYWLGSATTVFTALATATPTEPEGVGE